METFVKTTPIVDENYTGQAMKIDKRGGRYEGFWENGVFQNGIYTYIDEKEKQSRGKMILFTDGMGEFHVGCSLVKISGVNMCKMYRGELQYGKQHGLGTLYLYHDDPEKSDIILYKGMWENGKRRGYGKLYDITKTLIYEGNWHTDMKWGHGVYAWANGDVYEGMWVGGRRKGKGVYKYANGEMYEGEWFQNKKHGVGRYFWTNGDVYEGPFDNDLPSLQLLLHRHCEHDTLRPGLFTRLYRLDDTQYVPVRSTGWDSWLKYNSEKKPLLVDDSWLRRLHEAQPPAADALRYKYLGLFKITDLKMNLIEYRCFNNEGDIDKERMNKYNMILEKRRLVMVLNNVTIRKTNENKNGEKLKLGDTIDIKFILESIGYRF